MNAAGGRAGARAALAGFPEWAQEVDFGLAIQPQLVLEGNVHDIHPLPAGLGVDHEPTLAMLSRVFDINAYDLVLSFDPVAGMTVLGTPSEAGQSAVDAYTAETEVEISLQSLRDVLAHFVPTDETPPEELAALPATAIVLDYASRLRSSGDQVSDQVHLFFAFAEKLAHQAVPLPETHLFNPVVWLVDRAADLPAWLATSGRSRAIAVPRPSLAVRNRFAPGLLAALPGSAELSDSQRAAGGRRFAELTDGMTMQEVHDVQALARDRAIGPENIADAVRTFRSGVGEDKWRNHDLAGKLANANATLGRRIHGQEKPIARAVDVLFRAYMGLNGSQHGESVKGKPKGVLFFAGPSGVGKTELAKQLAALVFGTEDSLVRFDMSEYTSASSETRLVGAPPSFVGHEAGGQLTDAVRDKPFSILLFDEIEKADPTILRKFLQVLEDGRLTDGHGKTVSFTDTIIIFTSNTGVIGPDGTQLLTSANTRAEVEESVARAVREYFSNEPVLMPELLNRVGEDNIVVFDFIRSPHDMKIFDDDLAHVLAAVERQHDAKVTLHEDARAAIAGRLHEYLHFGGRGIANLVGEALVNPLSRELFGLMPVAGKTFEVVSATMADSGPSVVVEAR